jgi:hypothetical protein
MPVINSVTGMLDLQARVHLEEVEVPVAVDDELDRAGREVADGLAERHGLLAHCLARGGVEEGRRRLLDDLLVAALDRAFALTEIDKMLPCWSPSTWISMWRGWVDELLDEDAVVAERGFWPRSRTTRNPRAPQASFQAMRMPLPPPPAEALIMTG